MWYIFAAWTMSEEYPYQIKLGFNFNQASGNKMYAPGTIRRSFFFSSNCIICFSECLAKANKKDKYFSTKFNCAGQWH